MTRSPGCGSKSAGHRRTRPLRNGDRWTVTVATRDELCVTNLDNHRRHTIPADYIAAGNVTVDYASTINRAQGVTVDEAHVIIGERTNAKHNETSGAAGPARSLLAYDH